MPTYYYTKFQKNPCVGRNERCPFKFLEVKFSLYLNKRVFVMRMCEVSRDKNLYKLPTPQRQ